MSATIEYKIDSRKNEELELRNKDTHPQGYIQTMKILLYFFTILFLLIIIIIIIS